MVVTEQQVYAILDVNLGGEMYIVIKHAVQVFLGLIVQACAGIVQMKRCVIMLPEIVMRDVYPGTRNQHVKQLVTVIFTEKIVACVVDTV